MKRLILCASVWVLLSSLAQAAPVVEYKFDGDALDTSGNNEHGTLLGGASFAAGMFGQALSLDGVNDYVDVGIGNYNLSNFTVELWVNVPTYGDNLHYVVVTRFLDRCFVRV